LVKETKLCITNAKKFRTELYIKALQLKVVLQPDFCK